MRVARGLAFAYVALEAASAAADEAELQRRIEAQDAVIRGLADRLRAIEDERATDLGGRVVQETMQPAAPQPLQQPMEHVANTGHAVSQSTYGSLRLRLYTYVRYPAPFRGRSGVGLATSITEPRSDRSGG